METVRNKEGRESVEEVSQHLSTSMLSTLGKSLRGGTADLTSHLEHTFTQLAGTQRDKIELKMMREKMRGIRDRCPGPNVI